MRFLADECFFYFTIKAMRDRGHEIDSVCERKLSGSNDDEIIQLCIKENRILITFDNDFSNIFHFPVGSNPGIIIVKINPPMIEEITSAILSFLSRNEPANFANGLTIITRSKIRVCKSGCPTVQLDM